MNKFHLNQSGFTLTEVMLVMMVAAMLISLPSIFAGSYTKKMEEQLFLEQFQSSLSLIQNETILNGKRTKMSIYPANRQIRFGVANEAGHPINHTLHFPETVSLKGTVKDISFSQGTGSFSKIETLIFQFGEKEVQVVLQMGRGRYEIKVE